MMKTLKKILVLTLAIFSACALCLFPKKQETESHADVLKDGAFKYMSLSQSGQVLNSSKLTTINNATYVITNKAVTINLYPLDYKYKITENTISSNFYPQTETIVLERDTETNKFPESFMFQGRKFYYQISGLTLNISHKHITGTPTFPVSSDKRDTDLLSYKEEENKIEIYITYAYVTKQNDFVDDESNPTNTCTFEFEITNKSTYTLNIQEPVVNFFKLSEPIVMFDTNKIDDGGNPYPAEKSLAPDQVFSKLKISFVNNDYTEGNPLYFKINFNGFVYDFKLFSKEVDGENLLFVNYIDEYTNSKEGISYKNSESLATIESYSTVTKEYVYSNKIKAKEGNDFNEFSLVFENTGRYDIEFYDSTYVQGMTNANHYKTSFYIREEGATVTPFDNIYVVAETVKDNGGHIDYIVSDSTLNNLVKITIKNLDNFGKDGSGNPITLADVIENIVVKTTDFGIDRVDTIEKIYSVEEILALLQNGDFVLNYDADAYYQIEINPKQKVVDGKQVKPVKYVFTIVRYAKTTFSFKNQKHEATTPYYTQIRYYHHQIESKLFISYEYSLTPTFNSDDDIDLYKTFINRFNVKFGVKKVNIEKYTPEKKSDDEKIPVGLYLKVYGVGDITVYLTSNGKTEVLTLNSERGNNQVIKLGYGTYTIKIVDSMGTESETMTFSIKKGLNTSAMILIVLSGILASVVIIFILRARGKVGTR